MARFALADDSQVDWVSFRRLLVFVSAALILLCLLATVYRAVLVPITFSIFFTYLLLPLVDRCEAWKFDRQLASGGIIILGIGLVAFLVSKLFPALYVQVMELLQRAPYAAHYLTRNGLPVLQEFVVGLGLYDEQSFREAIQQYSISTEVIDRLRDGVTQIWTTAPDLLGGMINVALAPILTFFFLKEYPRILSYLQRITPADLRWPLQTFFVRLARTLRSVIKGQATVAGLLSVLYVIGFSIVGLDFGLVIGVVAGICRIIPYFDVLVGGILSAIVLASNFTDWGSVFGVLIVFGIVQTIDGMLITPRIMGERAGIHPMVVIVSIFAFADWMGFYGVLLAVPTVAVAKVVWQSALPVYLRSPAFRREALSTPGTRREHQNEVQ